MAAQARKTRTTDAYEEKAGRAGNGLALLGTAEAAELHQRLVDHQRAAEAARVALDAARERAFELREKARTVQRAFKHALASLPELGAFVLKLEKPAPALSEFEVWDPEVRCQELIEWLSGDAYAKVIAVKLELVRDEARVAEKEAAAAEREVKKLVQLHGAARYRLQTAARECTLHVKLNAKRGTAAYRAVVRERVKIEVVEASASPDAPGSSPMAGLPTTGFQTHGIAATSHGPAMESYMPVAARRPTPEPEFKTQGAGLSGRDHSAENASRGLDPVS